MNFKLILGSLAIYSFVKWSGAHSQEILFKKVIQFCVIVAVNGNCIFVDHAFFVTLNDVLDLVCNLN